MYYLSITQLDQLSTYKLYCIYYQSFHNVCKRTLSLSKLYPKQCHAFLESIIWLVMFACIFKLLLIS